MNFADFSPDAQPASTNGDATRRHRKCPICGERVPLDRQDSFCSDRCKKIDLGKWLSGDYTISRPIEQSDLEEGE